MSLNRTGFKTFKILFELVITFFGQFAPTIRKLVKCKFVDKCVCQRKGLPFDDDNDDNVDDVVDDNNYDDSSDDGPTPWPVSYGIS